MSSTTRNKPTTTTKKKVVKYEIKKWETPILYFISNNFKNFNEAKKIIYNVIEGIKNNSCIEFKKEDNEIKNKRGINFKNSDKCEIMKIGTNKEEKPQNIYLTDECVESKRTIRSLLFQTLGLLSPVLRRDKNAYVTINLKNVIINKRNIFSYEYLAINNYVDPYDFGSITHYNSTMLSVDKTIKTIEPKGKYKEYYENMMGRIEEPSFYDYKTLNKYYCGEKCNKKECGESKYNDPKNCSRCIGRINYNYLFDNGINYNLNKDCGYFKIYAEDQLKHIVKSKIAHCFYFIKTIFATGRVYIRFPSFRGAFIKKECSLENSIEIRYKNSFAAPGIFLCYNDDFEAPEFVSESVTLRVIYHFKWYETYAHFEYKRIFDEEFKYEKLSKLERIPVLRNETIDQIESVESGRI
uniref:Metalloendopeptidase n=1 Tax=Parastrongyloides trichosuri TaxID=131310 RepID=A0A0N4Z398_PARTI